MLPPLSLIPISIQIAAYPSRMGGIRERMRCEDQPTSPTWWRGTIRLEIGPHPSVKGARMVVATTDEYGGGDEGWW